MKTPGEVYRVGSRRLGRIVLGGYPETCEVVEARRGAIQDSRHRIDVSHAVSGRVWFFELI